jgi:hypothetical protein
MLNKIKQYWNSNPFLLIVIIGSLIRLIAAIFSKGYGMQDDHFLVIEPAESWVQGLDQNNWLNNNAESVPSGHSFFYVGLHYLFFNFLDWINITDAQFKMFLVRLIHGAYSMIIVVLGYKIAKKIADENIAKHVGLLLAVLWFLPWLSVHNMVEYFCVPPLMYATWLFVKHDAKPPLKIVVLGAFVAGLAVGIRYQTIFFLFGFGLVFLLKRQFLSLVVFTLISFASFFLTQASDLFIWGRPFAELGEYISYNIANSTSYYNQPFYTYFLTLAGMFGPIGLFMLFGYFKNWRKHAFIFIPSVLFFAFHSYFPNKQERFIAPMIPFVIILGYMGWMEFKNQSKFWNKHIKFYNGIWTFFWVVNSLLLIVISTAYTKKSRVETMTFLAEQKDMTNYIWDCSHKQDILLPPRFYSERWDRHVSLLDGFDIETSVRNSSYVPANYIVFVEDEKLEERKARLMKFFPKIQHLKTIEAGYLDLILHKMNPNNNKFERFHIYKIIESNL